MSTTARKHSSRTVNSARDRHFWYAHAFRIVRERAGRNDAGSRVNVAVIVKFMHLIGSSTWMPPMMPENRRPVKRPTIYRSIEGHH
jgi:hypothetical protein